MATPDPDWTPAIVVVIGGATLAVLRWIAIQFMMISPTHAAQKRLEAKQQKLHDDLRADMAETFDRIEALVNLSLKSSQLNHDAIGALAGHQEAQDARLAGLEKGVEFFQASRRDGR